MTHDLNVRVSMCDQVLVMQGGRMAERSPTVATLARPSAGYTRALAGSVLRMDAVPAAPVAGDAGPDGGSSAALLSVSGLGHRYAAGGW